MLGVKKTNLFFIFLFFLSFSAAYAQGQSATDIIDESVKTITFNLGSIEKNQNDLKIQLNNYKLIILNNQTIINNLQKMNEQQRNEYQSLLDISNQQTTQYLQLNRQCGQLQKQTTFLKKVIIPVTAIISAIAGAGVTYFIIKIL